MTQERICKVCGEPLEECACVDFVDLDQVEMKQDNVVSPPHYTYGNFEVIDIIAQAVDDFESYCMGNVIKYILRYRHKNGTEDLKKAQVCLEWAVNFKENKGDK